MKEEKLRELIMTNCPDVMERNKYLWENSLSQKKLTMWLENFKGKVFEQHTEADVALDLLKHFLYYSENELRYLCKSALSMLKYEKMREDPKRYLGAQSNRLLNEYLRSCIFSYIGYLSESSSYLLYPFRQECDIPVSQIVEPENLSRKKIDECLSKNAALIFLDDFCGTGQTGLNFWKSHAHDIKKNYPNIEIFYLALVAMNMGISRIRQHTGFSMICPVVLTDEYRVFSDCSIVFSDEKRRRMAKEICETYGKCLEGKTYVCGYGNSQILVGFHHNIPDNTLPVVWSDNKDWFPLFKRRKKRH